MLLRIFITLVVIYLLVVFARGTVRAIHNEIVSHYSWMAPTTQAALGWRM